MRATGIFSASECGNSASSGRRRMRSCGAARTAVLRRAAGARRRGNSSGGIREAAICCGSAGIYNLVQPDAANALGDRKANLIAPLKTDVVATGNPGCVLQLQASLARCGCETPVVHTIQLLDASIRGESSESLRR